MKTKLIGLVSILALAFSVLAGSAAAQNASPSSSNTTSSPTRTDQIVYFIWYGNWAANISQQIILADFVSGLGSSPYFQINQGYPDSSGQVPSGDIAYGGGALDAYSHGASLSEADVADVVANAFRTGGLVFDPLGIYAVLTSADVTVIDSVTQFCLTCCNLHGHSIVNGSDFRYVFVGSPRRCPGACATQFQSPNGDYSGNYEADSMASWLAAALSEVVTDPYDDAWHDRYGLENAEKCEGTYGTTYPVTNLWGQSAQANIKLGYRDYLLQQNWVNGKKGRCGLSR
ncbi:MAG: hypothetical protein E6H53_15070 [Betaproteobacteria bacterium]|nr:MAG: hypothetical protein E6H53_15070 [Betaproteobacteria bacterium]